MRTQRFRNALGKGVSLALLILLGGIAMGAALATYQLDRFSPIPSSVMLLFPLAVGVIIGILASTLGQALGIFFLTVLVYALASSLALSLPEFIHTHLGKEITIQTSVVQALTNGFLFILPLTIIGIIVGKLISRGD